MRIVDIRETVVPIESNIRNAYIDFSQMTVSVLALITDVVRGGKPVIGYGFNSNGRYAPSGLLRDRFLPRLKAAAPESLLDETGENFDPHRIWTAVMRNEKPGGHGERSGHAEHARGAFPAYPPPGGRHPHPHGPDAGD